MQRRLGALSLAVAGLFVVVATAAGSQAVISKADSALLRAMQDGRSSVHVIVGLKDGTTPAHVLRARPDPEGEPARRAQRLTAQQRAAAEMPPDQFWSPHFYGSFSMLAGVTTPRGLEALARRPDVAWIALDAKRGSDSAMQSQAPEELIHSDAANSLGFTGKGQTVAVLDTGVDQSVADLGGGGFPNAKVVGGLNVNEPSAPPSDCVGHGTSVASIIAGAGGVAPDAKIVAVKVFPGCEEFAFDSMILTGLDFAISHRAEFGITVLNMSLGGSATGDASNLGFCDGIEPQFSEPIDAATAAGIVVTVAAGNSATSNQISAPACLSSAVSVGAVYPTASSGFDWGTCSDTAIVPGTPTCFSNSASNLTLLAPGAFWNVPTAGGQIVSFSGTSAAAPAAAGAVALVRQARPGISPSTAVSILRATGRPVTDARNGVTTPLVDTLAAVQFAPATFGNLDAAPITIPDVGTATATTTVAGFSGYLDHVEAWVEIDHPDPRQLRITLNGPDTTSVLIHDVSGAPQQPINEIFGRTGASLFPLTQYRGTDPNGTWTLTVQDLVTGATGRILHFSVTPVAGIQQPPVEQIPFFADAVTIPIGARTHGTKFFQTDVRIYNPSIDPQEFDLYYVGSLQTGPTATKTTRLIEPGQVLALDDFVLSEFGQPDSFGQLTILGEDSGFLAGSHTFTRASAGTFGFAAPGFKNSSALTLGSGTAVANGLAKTPTMHTNVGFTETAGFPVTVKIDVRNSDGLLMATTSRTARPYTTYLVTDILLDRGIPSMTNFRTDFTVVRNPDGQPSGRAVAFATTVDKITGDSVFHAALMPATTTDDTIVAQSSHVVGRNGNFFQTTLDVTNLGSATVGFNVSLLPLILPPDFDLTKPTTKTYFILPGHTLEFLDVLSTEFDLDAPVAAGLRIHPLSVARLAVSSRTSITQFGGTSGFSIDGVLASSALSLNNVVTAIGLDQTSAVSGTRVNFGMTEVSGNDAFVQVTAVDGNTATALASKSYFVPAGTSFQANVEDLLGVGVEASNFYLQFTVMSGDGRVVAYAGAVDNGSGDVSYVPAQ